MYELLVALIGGIVGSVVTWLLGLRSSRRQTKAQEQLARAQDALAKSQAQVAEAHQRLADAQAERAKWEALAAFSPVGRIDGDNPDPQAVLVEAAEEFQVMRLDYCNASGAVIVSQPIQPPLVGKHIRVPINRSHVDQLYWKTYKDQTSRADVRFRVHVTVRGHRRDLSIPARLERDDAYGLVRLVG